MKKKPSGLPKERSGVLGRALADAGFRSLNAACVAAGAHPSQICDLANGKLPLIGERGRVNAQAAKLAEVLGETPERLFGGVETTEVVPERVANVTRAEVEGRELSRQVRMILRTLTDREREVFRQSMSGKPMTEIASYFGVSVERISHIYNKGLWRFRAHVSSYGVSYKSELLAML